MQVPLSKKKRRVQLLHLLAKHGPRHVTVWAGYKCRFSRCEYHAKSMAAIVRHEEAAHHSRSHRSSQDVDPTRPPAEPRADKVREFVAEVATRDSKLNLQDQDGDESAKGAAQRGRLSLVVRKKALEVDAATINVRGSAGSTRTGTLKAKAESQVWL